MRIPADVRISIKNNRTGEIYKIELVELPDKSFMVRFNDKASKKIKYENLVQIGVRIRKLLVIILGRKRKKV